MGPEKVHDDVARRTLGILFIVALLATCLWITRPFLPATIWATTLVIATWPIMLRLEAVLWHSRALAVAAMTLMLLLLFVAPFWLAIGTIVTHSGNIVRWAEALATMEVPEHPSWLASIPLIGRPIAQAWENVADSGMSELLQKIRPYAGRLTNWFIAAVGSFGMVLVQFLLTVAVSAVLYARGERAAAYAMRFGVRLAGSRGAQAVLLAGRAIRGVALGVIVTAFIQAAIGTAGMVITGVPYASVLSALLFMLCVAQLGPALVLIPVLAWMYWSGQPVGATVLLICSLLAIGADNVLRPIFIRRSLDLPLLLILIGVVGGLIAFGLIGIFLGPTVLAVGYTLLDAWVSEDREWGG